MPAVKGKETSSDSVLILGDSSTDTKVDKLRGRWELASVLNFLSVFEPVIGDDLKLTAEEIELGLVKPNASIAALHINLLKGTPPVSKLLNNSDAWVTALCKKLATWWPWVAEGEIPLTACKGEEMLRYKELDPSSRLLLLKALCEIRADQVDIVSYINDAVKRNKDVACFRKERLGGNGNVSYWYDGNTIFGYRLYREVKKIEQRKKAKGKACLAVPTVSSHWETLAVNLKEFRQVVDELFASKTAADVAIGKTISTDVIPVVEKFHKKKERALKKKKRQEMLLNDLRSSAGSGITRLCRNRRPISYTFDEYDRAIDEAIELTKRKTGEERRPGQKPAMQICSDVEGSASRGSSEEKGNSIGSDTDDQMLQEAGDESNEDEDDDYSSGKDDDDKNGSNSGNSADENNLVYKNHEREMARGSRWSKRLAGVAIHPLGAGNLGGTKNGLRQRLLVNSAIDTLVPDSEDDFSLEQTNSNILGPENLQSNADLEEVSDSKRF